MKEISINNELSDLAYKKVKDNLCKKRGYDQFQEFKQFIHEHYINESDLNGVFAGIHRLKQENLLDRLNLDSHNPEMFTKEYYTELIKMYWDCAILYKTFIK